MASKLFLAIIPLINGIANCLMHCLMHLFSESECVRLRLNQMEAEMSLAAFKKNYTEIFVSLTPLNGGQQWHRLERLNELGGLVEQWLSDAFNARVEKELDDPEDTSDMEIWSEACARMWDNTDALNEILRTGAQDFMIINTPELTEQEWDRLQLAENWKDQQAFKYWKKLTAQRSFAQLTDELQLNEEACKDMFFVEPHVYRHWMKEGAPRYVMDQLSFFEAAMEDLVDEWVGYVSSAILTLFDAKPEKIGVPAYASLEAYRACEPELARDLRFLSLFECFSRALLKELTIKNIHAQPVRIRAKEYFAWLKREHCVSTPSARILFSTKTLP